MSIKPSSEKTLFLTLTRVLLGLALLSLSTYLALESASYLEVLNQNGLNQFHAFGLLVCVSFFSGVFLIVQHVFAQDQADVDEAFEKAITY